MNKLLTSFFLFLFFFQQYLLGRSLELMMAPKDRNQVGNIVSIILLALIVSSGVFLAIVLYLSPSMH